MTPREYFQEDVFQTAIQIILGPVHQPDLIPTLMPIILGGIVLELYFGRYEHEELGWNSSVSNAVIWISTGLTLLLTSELVNVLEKTVTYFLIGLGLFIGYMNFFHKWSANIAYTASASGLVYSLAYVSVVMIKSGMPVNSITIQGAVLALSMIAIVFQVIKSFETPARDDLALDLS